MDGSAYMSKRLDIRPREVHKTAASWHRGLESVRLAPQYVRVNRRLWLYKDADSFRAGPLLLYGVRGLLWVNARPVRVTLEFSCWSDSSSEVGVRPAGIAWPVGSVQYDRQVAATLDAVYACLRSERLSECTSRQESNSTTRMVERAHRMNSRAIVRPQATHPEGFQSHDQSAGSSTSLSPHVQRDFDCRPTGLGSGLCVLTDCKPAECKFNPRADCLARLPRAWHSDVGRHVAHGNLRGPSSNDPNCEGSAGSDRSDGRVNLTQIRFG